MKRAVDCLETLLVSRIGIDNGHYAGRQYVSDSKKNNDKNSVDYDDSQKPGNLEAFVQFFYERIENSRKKDRKHNRLKETFQYFEHRSSQNYAHKDEKVENPFKKPVVFHALFFCRVIDRIFFLLFGKNLVESAVGNQNFRN